MGPGRTLLEVLVLLGIAFLAGVVTAVSPCVLPVLPVLLAGGASTRSPLRPYAIIAGLVGSFTLFTLAGASILGSLGLPADTLRTLAIALLFLLAATLLVPRLAHLLERPFYGLTRRRTGAEAPGLLLGASLGLVFVPCAGPVLAAITALSATGEVGGRAVAVTLAYALGAALPMLAFAVGAQRLTGTLGALRRHAATVRAGSGVLIGAAALAIALGADERFTTAIPGYTEALQEEIERSSPARRELGELRGREAARSPEPGPGPPAPEFVGLGEWLNTAGGMPLTLAGLRGKVVLVDFWTYSCVNCLRTLPHLRAWHRAYRDDGLVIVGVHTPEFAFEREPANVRAAVRKLGVEYPVALDNDFATWDAYLNEYWPAKYLIDRSGRVRYTHAGEGEYERTEALIRRYLGDAGAGADEVADATPRHPTTPESYLGYGRIDRFVGRPLARDSAAFYSFPERLAADELAFAGSWRVEEERAVAGSFARLRLQFTASEVHLVLGGRGEVRVLVDGEEAGSVDVRGEPRLYTVLERERVENGLLELSVDPGVAAYAFTFG